MNKHFVGITVGILFAIVTAVIVYQHVKATEVDLVLSCRNELLSTDTDTEPLEKHALIADFTLQKRSASISYRYFTESGEPIATLQMEGNILSAYKEKNVYVLNLMESELIRYDETEGLPQHAKHLRAFANRNIQREGVHNLTIQIVKSDEESNLALLYFLPSTNICACNLVRMN
ncbi:hypothetical protein [Shewanella maritima]|uniref:hypothetical protein n=1 Tax=Shewanella maritima TaxID=2520507 RepID=UPI003736347F